MPETPQTCAILVLMRLDFLSPPGCRSVASPIKLSRTPANYRLAPPLEIGQNTREVLDEAGLSEKQIELLLKRGVIRQASTGGNE